MEKFSLNESKLTLDERGTTKLLESSAQLFVDLKMPSCLDVEEFLQDQSFELNLPPLAEDESSDIFCIVYLTNCLQVLILPRQHIM